MTTKKKPLVRTPADYEAEIRHLERAREAENAGLTESLRTAESQIKEHQRALIRSENACRQLTAELETAKRDAGQAAAEASGDLYTLREQKAALALRLQVSDNAVRVLNAALESMRVELFECSLPNEEDA